MSQSDELLQKIYREVVAIRAELDKIKEQMIPWDDPSEDELEAIEQAEQEITEGKIINWEEAKKEL